MGRLRILTEGIEPAVLELPEGVVTLGRREDNPLRLPHDSVSGRHCDLAEADGLLTILDHSSTNGTFIKGERIEQGTVAAGETFKLGGVELRYEADSPAERAEPAISAPSLAPLLATPPAAASVAAPAPVVVETPAPVLVTAPAPAPAPVALPAPVPGASAATPATPKLSPAEALKQSLAKAASAPPVAPSPSPAPVSPAPPVAIPPPAAPVTPDSVKPPASRPALKFTLGDHKSAAAAPPAEPIAPAEADAPAAPAASARKSDGPKLVPTGEPSKFTLGGHGKPPSPPAPPAPVSAVVPTGAAPKFTLGSSHKPSPAPEASAPAQGVAVAATPLPPPAARGGKACKRHPANAARYVCKKCKELACDSCSPPTEIGGKTQHFCPVCKNLCLTLEQKAALESKALTRDGQTFRQRLPGVFKYPFNKNGMVFLLIGTVVFVALDLASRFSWKFAVLGIGYLFAYMQKIVRSSAVAEDELPGFPEVSEWRTELLQPFLLLTWTFFVSFGPAFGYMVYHTFADTEMSLTVLFPLFALGFLYFPMALLAVAMSSSYLAVNPLVVLPAITRLNLEYVGATAVFFGLVTARYLSETLLRAALPIPILPTLVSGFLALYFLACEMRLLGLIYYEHKKKLAWFSA